MARKPGTKAGGEFALFDVIYVDGSQRSNRRVPAGILGGLVMITPNVASRSERFAAVVARWISEFRLLTLQLA